MGINNANELKDEINENINKWNERSQFTIKGIKNLSRSDLDTLELYANNYIQSGGVSFNGLMEPLGKIGEVLKVYNIKSSNFSMF